MVLRKGTVHRSLATVLILSSCFPVVAAGAPKPASSPKGAASSKTADELQTGLAAFNAKKYGEAADHFQKYLKGRTPDPRTTYYVALCYMNTGQTARAKQYFDYIVRNFPQSQEFALSQKALTRWGGGAASGAVAGVVSGDPAGGVGDAELAKLPDTTDFRYQEGPNGHMEVTAYINGRPMTCWFDTGASAYFGKNQLRELGIPLPQGPADGVTAGWAGRPVETWHVTTSVKIGNMTRVLPLTVAEEWDNPPLVGQDFVKGFQYAIDSGGKRVTLTKKLTVAAGTRTNSLYDVPCVVEGEREYVTVNVEGKPCSGVLIDTGASMTIISNDRAASMGLNIPEDAPMMMAGGVGGMIPFRKVELDLRLGPIIKQDFPVMIGGNAGCAIGQDFMSGWRFTVDRDAKLLKFFH
jgi:Uncharacterized protein conserved in bacteria